MLRKMIATAAMAVSLHVAMARPVSAQEDKLTGWWIEAGGALTPFIRRGEITPHLQLLIVGPSGAVEERLVPISQSTASSTVCKQDGICSDAPLLGRSSVKIEGGLLTFSGWSPSANRVTVPDMDGPLRATAIANDGVWSVKGEQDGQRLRLTQAGQPARLLAKVDPEQFRRWRAAMRIGGWTKLDCAIERFLNLQAAGGEFERALMRGASYFTTIETYMSAQGSELADSAMVGHRPELFLTERFETVPEPVNKDLLRDLTLQYFYINSQLQGSSEQEVKETINSMLNGRPFQFGLSSDEVAALSKSRDETDAAVNELLCRG